MTDCSGLVVVKTVCDKVKYTELPDDYSMILLMILPALHNSIYLCNDEPSEQQTQQQ